MAHADDPHPAATRRLLGAAAAEALMWLLALALCAGLYFFAVHVGNQHGMR